ETYQPSLPEVPEIKAVVRGATVLMRIVTDCNASTLPATSIAKKSRTCCPSNRTKGAEYATRAPPSIRYWMPATPLGASVAWKEKVTADVYQPPCPKVPASVASVTGGVVSMAIDSERIGSVIPARSVAKNSTTCTPSARTKGPAYTDQGPPSTRKVMFAIQLVASDALQKADTEETNHPFAPAVREDSAAD